MELTIVYDKVVNKERCTLVAVPEIAWPYQEDNVIKTVELFQGVEKGKFTQYRIGVFSPKALARGFLKDGIEYHPNPYNDSLIKSITDEVMAFMTENHTADSWEVLEKIKI